ncbi:Ig-like domain-containing protein [Candidatus Microgenomates bacterium]|nr:Ig-like domain-containing protein [Candidatus Microgenomates bacterium]
MDKKLAGLIGLFFLAFFVFISLVVFSKPLSRFTRASSTVDPSAQQSIIIAFPLSLRANSSEESKLDVFVRSSSNSPVAGRDVSIEATIGTVSPAHVTTDRTGKATFQYSPAGDKGVAELTAVVDNTLRIAQKVTIQID